MKSKWSYLFLGTILVGIALVFYSVISLELFMLLILLLSGGIWFFGRLWMRKNQEQGVAEPEFVDYARSFFPVILAVLLLRSFLVEPFRIPSGSMIPTLHVGDFILVNKFAYGIRLPVANQKVIEVNSPQRGDVMVFRYPENPSMNFIKRVVGVPGDVIEYRGKQLTINGVVQQQQRDNEYNYVNSVSAFVHTERYAETLNGHTHAILLNPERPLLDVNAVADFPHRENCSFTEKLVRCTVPPGNYFMMGDNRDDSRDSRYWGFVPDNMIVGKAFAIWMNFGDLKRIGSTVN